MAASKQNNESYGPETDEMAVFGPFFLFMIAARRVNVSRGKRIKGSWQEQPLRRKGGMEKGERG